MSSKVFIQHMRACFIVHRTTMLYSAQVYDKTHCLIYIRGCSKMRSKGEARKTKRGCSLSLRNITNGQTGSHIHSLILYYTFKESEFGSQTLLFSMTEWERLTLLKIDHLLVDKKRSCAIGHLILVFLLVCWRQKSVEDFWSLRKVRKKYF